MAVVVKQLIEKLQEMPQDAVVLVHCPSEDVVYDALDDDIVPTLAVSGKCVVL